MALIQTVDELVNLVTIRDVSVVGLLLAFIIYFWYENKQLKKRIEKVIDDHQNDLKEANRDVKTMIEKWHDLTNEIKDIIRPR